MASKDLKNSARCKKLYYKKKAMGICTGCSNPAIPNRTQCAYCTEVNKKSQEKRKDKIKAYKVSIRDIEYARKKTPESKAKRNAYRRNKRKTDPAWGMADRLRKRIGRAMRDHAKIRKNGRTHELLGCTISELMFYIESQFLPGMTWDNRSEWHLDHCRPCASFDLTDPEQQKICFNFKNLQPLWAVDNIRKHAKWQPELQVA